MEKVYLYLTNACNKSCEFCYQKPSLVQEDNTVSIDSMLDYLLSFKKIKQLILFGGEPLLKKEVIDELLCRISNVDEVIITTNGLLIDDEVLSWLDKCSNLYIQISVDNPLELKKVYKHRQIHYHMTISNRNIKYVEAIYNRLLFKGADIWFSFDRCLKEDITDKVEYLLDKNIIGRHTLRKTEGDPSGKTCPVFSSKQELLNTVTGEKHPCGHLMFVPGEEVHDCMKECDNSYCDVCHCKSINRDISYLCKVFKKIEKK